MNNDILNLNLKKIYSSIEKNEIDEAHKLLLKIKNLAPAELILNLSGLINFKKKDYKSSINFYIKAIELNPNYLNAYINLFSVYNKIDNFAESEKVVRKALKFYPKSDAINNALGYSLLKQNKNEDAIIFFKIAIKLNSQNYKAFFNIGNAYFKIKNFQKAIQYFEKTFKINSKAPETTFYIAECNKEMQNYNEALNYYKIASKENNSWLRKNKIIAKILECYLILNKKNDYLEDISMYSKADPDNRRIAATSAFIAHQFNVKDQYPFCPNPFDFIYKSTLENYVNNYKFFLNSLFNEIMLLNFKWEGHTTRNGYRTTENLSEKKLPFISKLEKYILLELNKYFQIHKDKKIKFIENWPNKFKFQSWSNRLKKQGHNITHIHPGGWISAVFYLKIPKDIKNNEAGIEFSLHGDNYYVVNKNIPTKVLHPEEGNIILFPSSLFHKTIPFESDEERVGIAMDLCKE